MDEVEYYTILVLWITDAYARDQMNKCCTLTRTLWERRLGAIRLSESFLTSFNFRTSSTKDGYTNQKDFSEASELYKPLIWTVADTPNEKMESREF